MLHSLLEEIDGVSGVEIPGDDSRSAVHLFLVRYEAEAFGGLSRTKLLEAMAAEGTPAAPGYTPLHRMGMFQRDASGRSPAERDTGLELDMGSVSLPVTEAITGGGGFWIYQKLFMRDGSQIEAYAASLRKIQSHYSEIA